MRIGKNGEVRVSAPLLLPKSQIDAFIEANRDWMAKAKERTLKNVEKRNCFYNKLSLKTKQEKQVAINKLYDIVAPMFEKYAKLMAIDATLVVFSATKTKWGSCYPCTKTYDKIPNLSFMLPEHGNFHNAVAKIQLSLYLLLLPEWCIESVVVHELCHVFVKNHGPKFYALMEKYFPRWKEANKEMKKGF